MSVEAKKIKEFSIWNSVVNDRIIQFEELEKKYNTKDLQNQNLVDENGTLRERNSILLSKVDILVSKLDEKQNELTEKQNENEILIKQIQNMENSTSWKITKPIRIFFDKFRR